MIQANSAVERTRKADIMAVQFFNRSRSYDATRQAVHFWGYDGAMETSFFVTADALRRFQPNLRIAADFLETFDLNLDRIHESAKRVYARGRRGSYNLSAADF